MSFAFATRLPLGRARAAGLDGACVYPLPPLHMLYIWAIIRDFDAWPPALEQWSRVETCVSEAQAPTSLVLQGMEVSVLIEHKKLSTRHP